MLNALIHFCLSIDQYLVALVSEYGRWTYAFLFLVIFCETGLIITPFLPGDSLLFIAGGLSAQQPAPLNFIYLFLMLVLASCLGNQINYQCGHWIGERVFSLKNRWFLKQKHFKQAHDFYQKHGKMTLIVSRFMPIIRTFAPFIAGVARMKHQTFVLFNFISALLWIGSLLSLGYLLGQVPAVQRNLNLMIYGIILLSILPSIVMSVKAKRN